MHGLPLADLSWSALAPLLVATLRILPAVLVAPLFPAAVFPAMLRNTFVLSVALALYPHAAAHLPAPELGPLGWGALVGKEVLVGALLGAAVGVLIRALESVGAMLDVQIGLSNALLYDPFGGHEAGPYSGLLSRLGVALFVVGGGVQALLLLLFESYRVWPIAAFHPVIAAPLVGFSAGDFGAIADLAVRLAAPAILVLVLIDLGFGLVNRVVPQLNVFFFTMPIKGVVAALMLALYASYVADIALAETERVRGVIERLQPALSGT